MTDADGTSSTGRDPGRDGERVEAEAPGPPTPGAVPDADAGLLGRLLRLDDPDATVRRVRRTALVLLGVLTVGVGAVTRSPWEVLATLVSGAMTLLGFQAIVAFSDRLVSRADKGPSPLQAGLLALRYVLLGLVLCAMFLLPGVGPIPVLLGLSILVLAILLEAISQALRSGPGAP